MSLVNRAGAEALRDQVRKSAGDDREQLLKRQIVKHFDDLHAKDVRTDPDIERLLIDDELTDLDRSYDDIGFVDGVIQFSPSSAAKCPRELFFKASKQRKDAIVTYPYQKRWTRNSTAVHRAVQRDLLYAEKFLPRPLFTVERTEDGRPAWERNIAHVIQLEHRGVRFQLYGMMDGILRHEDGSRIGFEFKTKSTTLAAIGEYKMKEASPDHVTQCSAYSLLFGVDEFIILYESVAKDAWAKGADAKPDLRPFVIRVTDEDRERLLDKWAGVAMDFYNAEISPPDFSKCIFCPFKTRCKEVEVG